MGKGYLVLESVLISQGSKDRKKHANLSHHLLSHKQNFSQARVNLLFRVIHSKRLIWKALLLDKILATKREKQSEGFFVCVFCWANVFNICISVGLLKIKVAIYSLHHQLKRPELQVEEEKSRLQLWQRLKAGWIFSWDLSLKFWYQIQFRILGRNRKWPSSEYSFSLLKTIYFMVLTACQSHLESSRV